ncbi:MAG: Dihydrolipoyllysine-residue succinyltransferase component of 2-oxoglutarate dehydrogenase complex [Steroidobacteraceae bacterium]|nr:Dihydrolipoyllysine-residue succinyltransferase component of 2-oxoglutarate dehydrogenase complex [Steroidobacteraceae bacterium]
MTIEIKVPQLPESVADATLVAWHKKAGDAVRRDDNLADLETDKVVLEVPAPTNGVLKEIRIQGGTTVTSGQVLAIIEEGAAAAAVAPREQPVAGGGQTEAQRVPPAPGRDAAKLSPSVRRLVEENQLDPGQIPASGRDGRLTKSDVVGFLDRTPAAAATPAAPPPASPAAPAARPGPRVGRRDQRVPMTRLRQRIAERLVAAQATQALLTTFNEVDLSAVIALRARYKDRFEKEFGVKLGFMGLFVKASIEALRRYPVVNASVEGADIVYHEYYDIGVAVSTDRGLMVPIVRDADQKNLASVEKEIGDYAAKARQGAIAIEDLTGGTFTITNGGVFGSLLSTPIVNAPQSAILGMHKTQDRPVVVGGQVVVRPMMYVALTYDHRIIDGREAVQFLVAVKEALEDPARILLGV